MQQILDLISHLPEHLQTWAATYGSGLYLILALIIFAETGLVVTPILPGDSLLFAAGTNTIYSASLANSPLTFAAIGNISDIRSIAFSLNYGGRSNHEQIAVWGSAAECAGSCEQLRFRHSNECFAH